MDGPNDVSESAPQFGVWLAWDRERTEVIARGESSVHAGLTAAVVYGRFDVVLEYLPLVERDPSIGTLGSLIAHIFEQAASLESPDGNPEQGLSEFSRN